MYAMQPVRYITNKTSKEKIVLSTPDCGPVNSNLVYKPAGEKQPLVSAVEV